MTYSIDEMTAQEIKTATAIVGACRETLMGAARAVAATTGASAADVSRSDGFKSLALGMLEDAAKEFGHGECRPDALRAAMCAAMAGAL